MTGYFEIVVEKMPPLDSTGRSWFRVYVAGRPELEATRETATDAITNLTSAHIDKLNMLADDETYRIEYPSR